MPYNHYLQISEERYELLCNQYNKFMKDVDDITKDPFRLFEPLNSEQIQELELIREVSRDLQNKKDEDKKKVEEAALKAENAAKDNKQSANTDETNETEEQTEPAA